MDASQIGKGELPISCQTKEDIFCKLGKATPIDYIYKKNQT